MFANYKITQNGFYILGHNSQAYKIENQVESWGFEGKESFASGRGYIWSRSLPLLQKTLWKGFGPDTYAIYFPQHDVVGKFKAFSNVAKLVDKPHNMYLQIAINTGLISLGAVLILFAVYFFRSLKIYWKSNFDSWYARAGCGIFAAFIGYTGAGVFNDSNLSVSPVFWTLLGIGLMVELKLRDVDNCRV